MPQPGNRGPHGGFPDGMNQQPGGPNRQGGGTSGGNNLLRLLVMAIIAVAVLYFLYQCTFAGYDYDDGSYSGYSGTSSTGQDYGYDLADLFFPTVGATNTQEISATSLQGSTTATQTSGQEGKTLAISGLRDHFVDPSNARTATVLVYMCGADLETYSSAASKDLQEMVNADLGDNVKVIVQTGGAARWHFSSKADARKLQRWEINGDGMYYLGEVGRGTMLDVDTVTDFAKWGIQNYPADRYMFYFWDHGGGTIGGYGSDEVYPNADPLSLLELRQALAATGQKFDMVGFDACLMGTIECAYAMEPVADYLLASEEYEMGDGWMWTGFLSALGKNPAISTVELGKVAIDDFTSYYFKQRLGEITLSLVDLREVPYVYEQMGEFLTAAEKSIETDNRRFNEMSKARTAARAFADGAIDQVDVIDLIGRTEFDGRDELLAAVQSCVKYRSGTTISGANGLAMYFPYSEVRQYNGMRSILSDIGYVKPTEFYDYFLSIMSGSHAGGTGGLISSDSDAWTTSGSAASSAASTESYADQTYSLEDWFEALFASQFNYQPLPSQLSIEQDFDEGGYVIPMTSQLWDAIGSFRTTVMEEYGDGYLMLGTDDVYAQTDDDDLVVFYSGEWLTVGGVPVSFFSDQPYQEDSGEYSHSGKIPALLNGETAIDIYVYWPPESEQTGDYTGYIQGYRPSDDSNTYGRGYSQFSRGDVITPLFDYYDATGNYAETIHGRDITLNSSDDLEVTYQFYEHNTVHFWGTLITTYGDKINTAVIEQ